MVLGSIGVSAAIWAAVSSGWPRAAGLAEKKRIEINVGWSRVKQLRDIIMTLSFPDMFP
jgi:hypothetical protein